MKRGTLVNQWVRVDQLNYLRQSVYNLSAMSPDIKWGEFIEVSFSDKEMYKIFGKNFMETIKNNNILYPKTDHGERGNGAYLFYSKKEFAKAFYVCYHLSLQKGNGIRPNGLITKSTYEAMKESPVWGKIGKKLEKFPEFCGEDRLVLDDLIRPFVISGIR